MTHPTFILAFLASLAGCQSYPTAAENIAACGALIERFESSVKTGDRATFENCLFCADETETHFTRAIFDLHTADRQLDERGQNLFGEKWGAISELGGMKLQDEEYSGRPIILLSNSAALVRASGEGHDLYLIHLSDQSRNTWRIQTASLFDAKLTREANLQIARTMADEYAAIAQKLGTQIKTEDDFRQAKAELSGLLLFGDRHAVYYLPKTPVTTTPVEPMIIPLDNGSPFMGVSRKPDKKK